MHRAIRLIALGASAALFAACGGNGGGPSIPATSQSSTPATTPQSRTVVDQGLVLHILPVGNPAQFTGPAFPRRVIPMGHASSSGGNLLYHGGPVQVAPHLYVVFWGSAWNSTGDPDGVANRLKSFYGVIGGSKWLNSVSQYTQSDGQHVGNAGNIFIGSYVDTSNTPPRRPSTSALAAEAARAAAHFGDYSASASYVVAMPTGIHPSGFGSSYCAWHSSTSASGGTIAFTNLPYMPDAGASCGADSVNSNGTLDGVTIVSGHEQAETETDPQPNSGWLDGNGAENGDKCAWISLEDNPNAGGYPTQPLWSNATSSCVQSY